MVPGAIQTVSPAPASGAQRPRILVPEKVSPDGLAMLRDHYDVETRLGLAPDELLAAIPAYDALIVRSETKVTAAVLAAGRKLRVVARAGVGVDNIDVDAATAHGIIVVNSPSGNIVAAAEHTITLLLATARNVGRADASMKGGKWERAPLVGVEVGRKTLGIVGLGKVGMKVARMATGLGMRVVAHDPYASADLAKEAGVELVDRLDAMLPAVDFLTIHTPLIATTLNLLGEERLRTMRPTARVLNVARGGVYNEEALLRALDEGWIAGAGIDVFTAEPPAPGSAAARLAAHPRVVATPHLGASTVEAQENVSLDVCAQVLEILRGGLPTAAVNAPLILPEEYRRLQPFVKLVERMGGLYTQHFAAAATSAAAGTGSTGPGGSGAGKAGRMVGGRRFELSYQGELAGVANTRPLFAALVRGLVSPITDAGGRDVNIVNAATVAREKGIAISETHSREARDQAYASLVTLRSLDSSSGETAAVVAAAERTIEGYVSGGRFFISKLGRFAANFTPEGTLLVLHNYDEPGKIGGVGTVLGRHGINITFMQVASLDRGVEASSNTAAAGVRGKEDRKDSGENEALMILGVDGLVGREVLDDLGRQEGILDVSLVRL